MWEFAKHAIKAIIDTYFYSVVINVVGDVVGLRAPRAPDTSLAGNVPVDRSGVGIDVSAGRRRPSHTAYRRQRTPSSSCVPLNVSCG
jgi:hypothetical protein